MNAAMNVTGQHEIHPDAEMLSAFAEQALHERERGDVLKHLRCAAGAGRWWRWRARRRRRRSRRRGAAGGRRRDAWWRSWGSASAPAAVVAATAVIAIYVHVRGVEQSAEMAKVRVAEQLRGIANGLGTATVRTGGTCSRSAPAAPEAKGLKPPALARLRASASVNPSAAAAISEPEERLGRQMAREAEIRRAEAASASGAEGTRTDGEGFPGPGGSASNPGTSRAWRRNENNGGRRRLARSPLPAGSANETVDRASRRVGHWRSTANRRNLLRSESASRSQVVPAGISTLRKSRRAECAAAHADSDSPSQRAARSFDCVGGPLMLAIDQVRRTVSQRGFRSDMGAGDEAVDRARRSGAQANASGLGNRKRRRPRGQPAGETSGSGGASQPGAVFELLNDQSQVWISEDGKTWTAE